MPDCALPQRSFGCPEFPRENIARFTTGLADLADLGYPGPYDPESPIVPVQIGTPETLARMNEFSLRKVVTGEH